MSRKIQGPLREGAPRSGGGAGGQSIYPSSKQGLGRHLSSFKTLLRQNLGFGSRVLPPPRQAVPPLPFRLNGRGASFAGSLLPLPCGVTRHSKTIINCFETAHPRREPSRWGHNCRDRPPGRSGARCGTARLGFIRRAGACSRRTFKIRLRRRTPSTIKVAV